MENPKIGLLGLPASGKTTVFNALTGSNAATGAYGLADMEPHVAVVTVPDPRLDVLGRMFRAKKITPLHVEYTDPAGVGREREATKSGAIAGRLLLLLSQMDALVQVVRVFDDPNTAHPLGSVDPVRDVGLMNDELVLSDLAIVEKRLERIEESMKKGKVDERPLLEREKELLSRFKVGLEQGRPIRSQERNEEEDKMTRHFQFLSGKPLVILLNIGESELSRKGEIEQLVRASLADPKVEVTSMSAKVEAELQQLPPEEAKEFQSMLGIEELAREHVLALCYRAMGLVTYLTAGEKETRAWPICAGTTAPGAAGVIHSDLERGFIRAEVIAYDDLVNAGSMAEARRKGLLRLEGRQYIVREGDVIEFLFQV
ncbi:MAG: redox-regulated ATPase YchF [Chloroflexota bacterium]|nr:MAG: redox-regulated ATPase YchF [Chloroflexota bacterium]